MIAVDIRVGYEVGKGDKNSKLFCNVKGGKYEFNFPHTDGYGNEVCIGRLISEYIQADNYALNGKKNVTKS